jgi:hypothetical protein
MGTNGTTHRIKKLEAQLAPAQDVWVMDIYEGCPYDTEASRRQREPQMKDGDLLILRRVWSCTPDDPPHSHAHEYPWDARRPPGEERWTTTQPPKVTPPRRQPEREVPPPLTDEEIRASHPELPPNW